MRKIGLFGGTFDPVHSGHVAITKSFLDSGLIDELWIILTPYPPHKFDENHAPFNTRFAMLKEAFSNLDCTIMDVENNLPKPSYTFRTIQFLKKKNPSSQFYFCMGEDSLSRFHTWKHYSKILEEADLLVAKRPNSNHDQVLPYILKQTSFVDHEPIEISSSEIRSKITDHAFLERNLPKSVISIIDKENLYR